MSKYNENISLYIKILWIGLLGKWGGGCITTDFIIYLFMEFINYQSDKLFVLLLSRSFPMAVAPLLVTLTLSIF